MRCRNPRFRLIRRFTRKEDGAATIEAILWLPFFLALFGLLADVSMIFHSQSKLLRIVQDANRARSIGRFGTDDQTDGRTVDFVLAQVGAISGDPTASSGETAGLITTSVSVPISDLDMFGVAGVFKGVRMTVWSEHLSEEF